MAAAEMCVLPDVESDYAELVVDGKSVTLGEKARNSMKDCQLRKCQQQRILRAISALLKHGGGVVRGETENEDFVYKRDGIGQDLEAGFCNIVPNVRKYLDFMQRGLIFQIFVKSSITDRKYGTLSTNLYRRNVTRVDEMNEATAIEFLKELKRTEGRSYSTPTLPADRACIDESHNEDLAAEFFNSKILTKNEQFCFTESTHVEFKLFLTDKLSQRIKEMLPKYVSAFANTDGGYLFIGLNEKTQKITGLEADKCDLVKLETKIEKSIRKLPVYHFCKEKKEINYTCKFLEVHNEKGLSGYVCAIRVERFCCAVFAEGPNSWHVKENCVVQMTSTEWIEFMMNDFSRPLGKLTSRATELPRIMAWSVAIFKKWRSLLRRSQPPVLLRNVIYTPKPIYRELFLQHEGLEQSVRNEMAPFRKGILIFSKSWSLDLGLQREEDVICEVLLIPMSSPPVLYTFFRIKEATEDSTTKHETVKKLQGYCKQTARTLKEKLVIDGGYGDKMFIRLKSFFLSPEGKATLFYDDFKVPYPKSYYCITTEIVTKFLEALYCLPLRNEFASEIKVIIDHVQNSRYRSCSE
ncbi:PREDICTED: schlafen family member 12-like [Chinchilla lanigera]|uniref:Schlafen family member 12-like n=1 Tax=Chinchilla lanigera TaxID=34839 RepID=A0A8C2W512_CHILA|nr:PREDICTED: schlafen family member 12-like [Chinchilla lanigera]XP_013358870.1 PREDICTED: schlafen family member 12-like [Chinchilla lanigera]